MQTGARTVQPLAVNFNATRLAYQDAIGLERVVRVYSWGGDRWLLESTLYSPVPVVSIHTFGEYLVFDRSGSTLAVGDILSGAAGAGVSESAIPGAEDHGAVFIFRRHATGSMPWALVSVVKAPVPATNNRIGEAVALSGSGRTLAIGAPYENSAARGIDGDRTDTSLQESGAVYLY